MIDPEIFKWDEFSDQPKVIHDKAIKREMYRKGRVGLFKTYLSAFLLPQYGLIKLFTKKQRTHYNEDGIGLCVNLEQTAEDKKILSAEEILTIVSELNLTRLSIRLPLHQVDCLNDYIEFIRHFSNYKLIVVILQERSFVQNESKLVGALKKIFSSLEGIVECYQIGNAINRCKWGFLSQDEYFRFFRVAYNLRNQEFPKLKLLGGAVIDFELPEHVRSLNNRFGIKYDGYSSLLYVDRRGSPENRQMGCNLIDKIHWIATLIRGSRNMVFHKEPRLWITEVNWPLRNTGLFAPAIGEVQVTEKEQLYFLVRYYLCTLASGHVKACFWHQLIAPGYGLIDNRGETICKRESFQGFSTLCQWFNGANILGLCYHRRSKHYELKAIQGNKAISALWCNGNEIEISCPPSREVLNILGERQSPASTIKLSDSVIYLIESNLDN